MGSVHMINYLSFYYMTYFINFVGKEYENLFIYSVNNTWLVVKMKRFNNINTYDN